MHEFRFQEKQVTSENLHRNAISILIDNCLYVSKNRALFMLPDDVNQKTIANSLSEIFMSRGEKVQLLSANDILNGTFLPKEGMVIITGYDGTAYDSTEIGPHNSQSKGPEENFQTVVRPFAQRNRENKLLMLTDLTINPLMLRRELPFGNTPFTTGETGNMWQIVIDEQEQVVRAYRLGKETVSEKEQWKLIETPLKIPFSFN